MSFMFSGGGVVMSEEETEKEVPLYILKTREALYEMFVGKDYIPAYFVLSINNQEYLEKVYFSLKDYIAKKGTEDKIVVDTEDFKKIAKETYEKMVDSKNEKSS